MRHGQNLIFQIDFRLGIQPCMNRNFFRLNFLLFLIVFPFLGMRSIRFGIYYLGIDFRTCLCWRNVRRLWMRIGCSLWMCCWWNAWCVWNFRCIAIRRGEIFQNRQSCYVRLNYRAGTSGIGCLTDVNLCKKKINASWNLKHPATKLWF